MIPDLTRTELAARLRSSIEGKEAWDYVATNVGLVASAVKFLAPSAGIADAMIADAKRQLGNKPTERKLADMIKADTGPADFQQKSPQSREEAYARGRGDAVREYIEKGDQRTAGGDAEHADGWNAMTVIGSTFTSVAFKDEKTARAMCVKGEPFSFKRISGEFAAPCTCDMMNQGADALRQGMSMLGSGRSLQDVAKYVYEAIRAATPAPVSADPQDERAAFEWDAEQCLGIDHAINRTSFRKDDDGGYQFASTRRLFKLWKAARASLPSAGAPAAARQPVLTVWEDAMPESNGKSNFTAVLMRKEEMWDGPHVTIERGEYPDRIRYEADRVRYIIGELADEPDILAYDADLHSGYIKPDWAGAPVGTAGPSDGPSDDKILDALVEALDVDRAGAMKLILRVAGAHLDEREVV